MCGASTWARAYRELVRRGTSPRTWVTPRHGRVYMVGKGRAGQVAAWMTVAHSPDCRTVHRDELEPAAPRSIELRVLLQNAAAASVSFDPALIQVDWLCVSHAARLERRLPLGGLVRRGGDLTEVRKARVRASPAPHVLDGSSPDARSGLLHPLQWAVLVVHVECGEFLSFSVCLFRGGRVSLFFPLRFSRLLLLLLPRILISSLSRSRVRLRVRVPRASGRAARAVPRALRHAPLPHRRAKCRRAVRDQRYSQLVHRAPRRLLRTLARHLKALSIYTHHAHNTHHAMHIILCSAVTPLRRFCPASLIIIFEASFIQIK